MPDFFASLRTDVEFDLSIITDFSEVSSDNHSYLQECIVYRPDLAMAVLEKTVNIDHQDNNGQTALQYAISRGLNELAENILRAGATIGVTDKYGNDALWTATMNPRPSIELIKYLIDLGANPFRKNNAGRSSFDMATTKQNKSILEIFNL